MEFTDAERQFIIMLLRIGRNILESQNNYMELEQCESFSGNDLFSLAVKLGLEDYF